VELIKRIKTAMRFLEKSYSYYINFFLICKKKDRTDGNKRPKQGSGQPKRGRNTLTSFVAPGNETPEVGLAGIMFKTFF